MGSMLTELEAVWRGRVAPIDDLLAADPPRRPPDHARHRRHVRHQHPDPDARIPLHVRHDLAGGREVHGGGTRATLVGTYASAEALQQVLDMGVVEGASSAINQIDGPLATG